MGVIIDIKAKYPKQAVAMLESAINKIKNESNMESMLKLVPQLETILEDLSKKSIVYEKEREKELKIEYELFKIDKKGCIQDNKKLKVLFFYGGRRNCTSRLQSDFILKLKNICDINVYGPKEHILNSEDICPIEYNKYITANDLIDELNPDIFLFHNITTFNRSKPRDLTKAKVPIVLSEVDYFAVPEWCKGQGVNIDKWFSDNRIDFLIVKGPYKDCVIPSVWLPFSVNEDEFYTDPNTDYFKNRKKDIGFIGSLGTTKYYDVRKKAIKLLIEKKLMAEEDVKYIAEPNDYANALKQYHILLSCSFPPYLNRPPAKNLEIMGSGTGLLTTWFTVKEELFGKDKCFFEYKEDLSDIYDVVTYMKNNLDEVEEVTKTALSVINEKHLDKHRIIELYDILKNVVDGKPVDKKWGY